MKNFNIRKIAFIALDIILVIVIAGAVLFGILGFNKSTNASKYVQVRVTLGQEYILKDNNVEKAEKDIKNILSKNGYKFVEDAYTEVDSKGYNVLVFNLKGNQVTSDNLSVTGEGSVYKQIKTYLETENVGYVFDAPEQEFKEFNVDYVGSAFSNKLYSKSLISMAIILVATIVYFLIRFKVASSMASLCVTIIEFLLFVSIVAITRIPVDGMFYVVLFGVLIASLISSFVYNNYFRMALNGAEEKTLLEHTQYVSCKAGKIIASVFIAVIAALLLAIIAVPSSIKVLLALLALGLLVVGICSVLIRPVFRYWLGLINCKKKTGYQGQAKQKQAKDE